MLASIIAGNSRQLIWLLMWLAWLAIAVCVSSPSWALESGQFAITPTVVGDQWIRVSVPWPKSLPGEDLLLEKSQAFTSQQWPFNPTSDNLNPSSGDSLTCVLQCLPDGARIQASIRVISWKQVDGQASQIPRRVMLTFEHRFPSIDETVFQLIGVESYDASVETSLANLAVARVVGEDVEVQYDRGSKLHFHFESPQRISASAATEEIIEANRFYLWKRIFYPDAKWPRKLDIRIDRSGTVVLIAHFQRVATEDGFAPDLGWTIEGSLDSNWQVYHPLAALHERAKIENSRTGDMTYRYWRCKAADQVPMQPYAWQRVEVVIAPTKLGRLNPDFRGPYSVRYCPEDLRAIYPHWQAFDGDAMPLSDLVQYHHHAINKSMVLGDDYGNVTGFNQGARAANAFGMNRLNHNSPIFESAWRSADPALMQTALLWCENFYDQSIWWGQPKFGGTRYNNVSAQNKEPLTRDYMWRSNDSVHFCTKGYDAFWMAWEETGDPRMLEALQAQVAYAAQDIHADQGECRNVGDVRDFVRLYRMTGEAHYREEALRLFRELRTRLSTGNLFDQGGKPIDADPPFIDDDQLGLKVGYAKPYIIGYALTGLPELLAVAPEEPELKDTIRAVADFLAESVDPAGGWRYPHPRSSLTLCSFGPEHAWHLCQASRALGPDPKWLKAIEVVLRARVQGWKRSGTILSNVEGWEISTGLVKNRLELQELYQHPSDRPRERDWSEGRVGFGSAPPEGLVYFEEVLNYYLQHGSLERLLMPPAEGEPLRAILNRTGP